MKIYSLPDHYQSWIETHLEALNFSLKDPAPLAEAIHLTSNRYLEGSDSTTHWDETTTQAAYLAYFFPLNYVRSMKVVDEMRALNFLDGLSHGVDFGCGPGTLTKSIMDGDMGSFQIDGVDSAAVVEKYFLDHGQNFTTTMEEGPKEDFFLLMSYTLNELVSEPLWFYQARAMVIIEPSSHQESRNLQEFRQSLIDRGYHIWAPCPHHHNCPLLEGKKDWCHDRVYWEMPSWFKAIDEKLPMKNESLGFSYLLARKDPPPPKDYWRVVGDARVEKGKTKWLICRDETKKFISCLHRHGEPPKIYRGDKIQLKQYEEKNTELRFQPNDIVVSS